MNFKHKINRAKQGADSLLDPFLVLAGYNLAALEGTYRLIEDGDPIKTAAGILGGGLALTWGNKAMLKGIGKIPGPIPKLTERAIDAYKAGKSADWKNWAKTGLLIGVLSAGIYNAEVTDSQKEEVLENPQDIETVLEVKERAPLEDIVESDTPLLGKKVLRGTLYAYYTGIDSILKDIEELPNNKEVLTELWHRKLELIRVKDKKSGELRNATSYEELNKNDPRRLLYEDEVIRFDEATNHKIALADYVTEFEDLIKETSQNINWDELASKGYLWGKNKEEKLELLKGFADRISAEDLVSIAMKELLPPGSAEYKAEILDFLLSVRGKQFVDHMPSLNDDLASIGLYQLTSYAVNGKKGTGASAINQFLPENMQIPGSIIYLGDWDHEKAAYLNLVASLADNISRLDKKAIDHLKDISDEDFNLLLGGFHHRPKDARTAVEYWSANNAEFPLIISMNERLTNYNIQVRENRTGLEAYLSNEEN